MADEKTKPQVENKKEDKSVSKSAQDVKTAVPASKTDVPSTSDHKEITADSKAKPAKVEKPKKTEVSAAGLNLHASLKHCMYISSFIKGKSIDRAIKELEEVTKMRRLIPFKGEIPHRSAPGMMSGRYPVAASKQLIYVLKGLKGNAISAGFDLDKTRITFANPNWASLPPRRGGGRFKRVNIYFKARELSTPQGGSPQQSEELRSKRGLSKTEAKK